MKETVSVWHYAVTSKNWVLPFAPPFHFDHDLLPIFKRCDIWKTQSHFGLLSSLEGGYEGNSRADTAHLQHITSSLSKKWRQPWIDVLLSQSARRTVTMGSPYLVIISRFFFFFLHWDVFIYFGDKRQEERKRRRDWNALPPTELHLSCGPLSRDKLVLEIRGHLLCLFTCSLHTVGSSTHTQRLSQLYPQWANRS